MTQEIYRADNLKWAWRILKLVILNGFFAVAFWYTYNSSHDVYFIILAALFAICAAVILISGLFTKPKLIISDSGLKFGKVDFEFSDVIDVKHRRDEYVFFLASRRRMTVKITDFTDADKKTIDRILAQKCLEHLKAEEAKEKIAGAANTGGLEFSYTAKRTQVLFAVSLMVYIFGGFALLACLLVFFLGEMGDSASTGVVITCLITVCIGAIIYILEKRAAKDVFTFGNDTFTLTRKNKVKFTFARGDVAGVGINPQGQAYIVFRLKEKNKRLRVPLSIFSRKDRQEMKAKIRSIFFLPDEKKKNTIF